MKIERSKNAARNAAYGIVLRFYVMLMPFVMRTVMVYVLGVNYLGLNSLFTSILQVLNLAESGVGSAMVFSMYRPIAEDDAARICALMRLYKIYYRIIGGIVFAGGMIVMPFLPYLIKSDVPADINLYTLYFLNILTTVSTYWMFAYKNCLLFAHQRTDISTKVSIATETGKYILQIITLAVFRDYYLYTIVIIMTQIINNIVTAFVVGKMYPNYTAKGKLAGEEVKAINKKIKDLFTAKLGNVIFNSTDTIVISAFMGLAVLAVYQNYFYILTSVTSIINIIFTSCTAGIGNSLITESREKNYRDLKKFTLFIVWITGFCTICFLVLYQPFMKIWMTEKLMLDFRAVICFCAYFFINQIYYLLEVYKDASGIWHEDRFRPLVVSLSNLGLNLILVQFIGIYGIILASCAAKAFIGIPWTMYNLFKIVFHKNKKDYFKKLGYYTIITVCVGAVVYFLCSCVIWEGIAGLVVKLIICLLLGNLLFFLIYRKDKEFLPLMETVKGILPQKLKGIIEFFMR